MEAWRSKTGAPQHEAALLTDAGPVRGADRLKRLQSTKKKGAGRGQTETAKRGRADEGRDSQNKRRGLTGEDGGGEMELEGGTGEGAEVTAEKLATKEGNELTTEGGDGLTAGEGAEVTAPREGEDGVNADMVEGMIVAAQQWEQELLMFDNEVTQELEGADCTSSGVAQNSADQPGATQEQLHSRGNHGPAEPHEANGSLWWVDRNNDPRGDGVNHNTRTSVLNSRQVTRQCRGIIWHVAHLTSPHLTAAEQKKSTPCNRACS